MPYCALAVVEELAGVAGPYPDPAMARLGIARTRREVGLDAARALDEVIATQRRFWRL